MEQVTGVQGHEAAKRGQKVQLIWPNFDCPLGPSIGMAYLSGALKEQGHDTNIIHISEWLDYPFDIERVGSDVKDYSPDLIAMSTGANHYPETRMLLKELTRIPHLHRHFRDLLSRFIYKIQYLIIALAVRPCRIRWVN